MFFLLFAVAGVASVVYGVNELVRQAGRRRSWRRTTGRVVDIVTESGGHNNPGTIYNYLVIEHQGADGRSHRARSGWGSNTRPSTPIGSPIEILVDPLNEDSFVPATGAHSASGAWLFIGVGVVLALVGGLLFALA